MTVFFVPPVPGEYHYKELGSGCGWMSLGLKTLIFARNLMQNTLDLTSSIQSISNMIHALAKLSGSRAGSGGSIYSYP